MCFQTGFRRVLYNRLRLRINLRLGFEISNRFRDFSFWEGCCCHGWSLESLSLGSLPCSQFCSADRTQICNITLLMYKEKQQRCLHEEQEVLPLLICSLLGNSVLAEAAGDRRFVDLLVCRWNLWLWVLSPTWLSGSQGGALGAGTAYCCWDGSGRRASRVESSRRTASDRRSGHLTRSSDHHLGGC